MPEKTIRQPPQPVGTLLERLERVQQIIPPKNVSVTLSPGTTPKDFTQVLDEYVLYLEMLAAYIQNGHSTKGLWFDGLWTEICTD